MIQLAFVFLVIGIVASLLGFTAIAGASYAIAKFIGALFLIGFVVLLLAAWGVGRAVSS